MIEDRLDFLKAYIKKHGLPQGATHIFVGVGYDIDDVNLFEKWDGDKVEEFVTDEGRWRRRYFDMTDHNRFKIPLEIIMDNYVSEPQQVQEAIGLRDVHIMDMGRRAADIRREQLKHYPIYPRF